MRTVQTIVTKDLRFCKACVSLVNHFLMTKVETFTGIERCTGY